MQVFGRVEPHATRPLHDGLQDHRGKDIFVFNDRPFKRRDIRVSTGLTKPTGRRFDKVLLGQHLTKQAMHARYRITYRHGAEGIAMITAAHGQKLLPGRLAPGLPVLNGHFHRHLDGDGSRIGKENRL